MGVPPPGASPCSPVPAAVLTPGAPLPALELSRSCGRATRPSAGFGRGGLGGGCPPEKWKDEGPGRPVALVQECPEGGVPRVPSLNETALRPWPRRLKGTEPGGRC